MAAPRRSPPEPLETRDLPVVVAGTALWATALLVLLLRGDGLSDPGSSRWVWVCVAGVFLGGVGLRHLQRRRRTQRDRERDQVAEADVAPREPLT